MSADVSVGETVGVGEMGAGGIEESAVVDIGEPSVGKAVVGETGVGETGTVGAGETGPRGVENCAGAAESCVETLRNEGTASEAA